MQMNRQLLIHIVVLLMSAHSASIWAQSSYSQMPCEEPPVGFLMRLVIKQPGRYCLSTDMLSKKYFTWGGFDGDSGNRGGVMVDIQESRVELDLREHSLVAESLHTAGVDGGLVGNYIHDGVIKSLTSTGVSMTRLFSYAWDDRLLGYFSGSGGFSKSYGITFSQMFPEVKSLIDRNKFTVTAHRLQNLRIEADSLGLVIKGAENIVRDNVIVVRNGRAVVAWGPRQIIEGNIIVVRGRVYGAQYLPVQLFLGDHSVIRNNIIVVEDGDDYEGVRPDAAISLIDSRDVVIENNKIVGLKALYKVWDTLPGQHSNVASEQGNTYPSTWERGKVFPSGWKRLLGGINGVVPP